MDGNNSAIPRPRKVAVWVEGTPIEAKEVIIPTKNTDSSDDIPTIPDLDDFQDILEKEISKPPVVSQADSETVNALSEVGGGITASEGTDAALAKLKANIPRVEMDTADTVWTIDSLLTQLAEDNGDFIIT